MPILDKLRALTHDQAPPLDSASGEPSPAALFNGDISGPSIAPTDRTRIPAPDPAFRSCGAVGCNAGWIKPWKNRTRPIFENEWGCSSRCLQSIVASAIRRETGEGIQDTDLTPHRHRVPLGLVLLAQNWITHPQLQAALQAQRDSGHGRIGDWLAQTCGLDQNHITRGLGMQWGCPIFTMDGFEAAAMALIMPQRFMTEFGVVPLRVAGRNHLYLASVDRMDSSTAFAVEQMTGLKVEPGLLDEQHFTEARGAVMAAGGVALTVATAPDSDALTTRIARRLEQERPVASRLVRVHQYFWLRTWLESGSFSGIGSLPAGTSDVHDYIFTIGR